ncbi:MAG: T9SS type A sorting domain-containing protein [Salinivirgaceae bacterium]
MKKQLLFITALMLASVLGAQDFNQRIVEKFKHHPQKRGSHALNYGTVKLDRMQMFFNLESEFVEFSRTEFEYTGQGQLQSETEYTAGETELELDYRNRYFYQNGLMSYELGMVYDTVAEQWELEDSTTFTYEDGLLVREDYFWYDAVNDEMDHDEICHYYYTGSQLDSIIITFWDDSQEKETYEYADGNMVKYSAFDLEDDGSWFEFERITYAWDNGRLQEMIFQEEDEMDEVLVNSERTTYTWEASGSLDVQTSYEWNGEMEQWDPMMRMSPFYNFNITADELVLPFFADEEGDPLEIFTHQIDSAYMDMYDAEAGWGQSAIIKFTYSDFVGMNETVNTNATHLDVYPNPAKDQLNLNFPLEQQTSASICDNLGRVIKTVTLNNSNSIDISELNSGFYYLILTEGEHSGQMAKFIVQ